MYKIFVVAVVILCSFDVANALMCYNCTYPVCTGKTIEDTTVIDQIPCTGSCATTKSTSTILGTEVTAYERTCLEFCPGSTCIDFSNGDGTTSRACVQCCTTDLCNLNYESGSSTTTPDPNSGIRGIANLVIVLLAFWLCTTLMA